MTLRVRLASVMASAAVQQTTLVHVPVHACAKSVYDMCKVGKVVGLILLSSYLCCLLAESGMLLRIAATAPADFSATIARESVSRASTTATAIQACEGRESVSVLRVLTQTPGVRRACPDILEINASVVRVATFHTEIVMMAQQAVVAARVPLALMLT